MVRLDVDWDERFIDIHMFKDYDEAMAFLKRLTDCVKEMKERYLIDFGDDKKGDLLDIMFVEFIWYPLNKPDDNPYGIKISVDNRICPELSNQIFKDIISTFPDATYRVLDDDMKEFVRKLYTGEE